MGSEAVRQAHDGGSAGFLVEIAGNYSRVGAIFEQMSSFRYSAACLDLTGLRYGVMRFAY